MKNLDGKYTRIRYSVIIGYIDSYDAVHSEIFYYGEDRGCFKSHYDIFGVVLKGWRWDFIHGLDISAMARGINEEDCERIRQHISDTYGFPFGSNGFHDMDFFKKHMDEEDRLLTQN